MHIFWHIVAENAVRELLSRQNCEKAEVFHSRYERAAGIVRFPSIWLLALSKAGLMLMSCSGELKS